MTITTTPAGFTADEWRSCGGAGTRRVLFGADRTVTDHEVIVSTEALQWADGRIEAPCAALLDGRMDTRIRLNSDQARELAAALLAAADELDAAYGSGLRL